MRASLISFSLLLLILVFAPMTTDARYIALPGLACIFMVLWLWMTLWRRDQETPFFDAGVFCALATLVYTVYPLVNYWVDGFQFGFLSDSRLQSHNISPAELGFFHLRHVLYLLSFVVFYSAFRGTSSIIVGNVRAPSRPARWFIVLFFLILTCYFIVLQITTGATYNLSYESEAYAQGLLAFATLPLPLLQISNKLAGILFIFKLALLFIVVSRCRQKAWLVILLVWMGAEIIHAFLLKGSRSNLVFFIMATALLYHRMIKPLSTKFLLTSGISLFIFFIFFGLYRTYIDFASLQSDLSLAEGGIFSGGNEFQALLGTAYDVMQMKEGGTDLPWYLYINDVINILPPQQLMPFEKVPASEWYLREIGISGTGIGFMWGVISQSIIGLDWVELALRGGILGYILARIHRWYVNHQSGFLETLFYMYLCLRVYYTFRDTTFSLLSYLVWEVVPFYIILQLGVAITSLSRHNTQGIGMAISTESSK